MEDESIQEETKQTQDNLIMTKNDFEEEKVPIQHLKLTKKNDFTIDRKSYRDFKGVNNLNLFESDDEEEGPFKPEESIDEKQTVF